MRSRAGFALLVVSCFNPRLQNGVPCASGEQQCPKGQICAQDNRCYDPDAVPNFGDAGLDGSTADATRSGLVVLAQTSLKDDTLAGFNLRGPAFLVEFVDLETVAEAAFDDTEAGSGCVVHQFTSPSPQPREVDGGALAITGLGGIGDVACRFEGTLGYRCEPAVGATGTVVGGASIASSPIPEIVDVTIPGANFAAIGGTSARGMSINFPTGTWDDGVNNGRFPISVVPSADTITITHPLSIPDGDGPLNQNDFRITVGDAFSIGPGDPYNLFELANGQVSSAPFTVAKAAGAALDSFDVTIGPASVAGDELDIRLVSAQGADLGPFEPFSLGATEFRISCSDNGVGGNCQDGAPASALLFFGRTTDGVLPDSGEPILDDLAMPNPVGSYSTFFCIFEGQKSATIPQGALDAINANPATTRIEIQVVYASGETIVESDGDTVRVLSGYGVAGYTDL